MQFPAKNSALRFGPFELDLRSYELRKGGIPIHLPPQPCKVLALLALQPHRVFRRQEIQREIWGGETFVDFEQGLNVCIRHIRAALGDRAEKPRYIETLQRRGYRFIAEVCSLETREALVPTHPPLSRAEAYEQYSKGRRQFHEFGKTALEDARLHFERALALDPRYAMAHSALGATYAMRFVHRTDPDDLTRAQANLERARQLDPELSEPYPWLCYLYMCQGKLQEALSAGKRAIHLQPHLVQAHYFLGLAYFVSCEVGPDNYQDAANYLLQAGQLEPHWQPTWFVLAALAILHGNYDRAEEFSHRLLQLSGEEVAGRFIGGEMLLGTVWLRRENWREARSWYTQSLETLARLDHLYCHTFRALSACGIGDVYVREGKPDLALAAYRRAWQIVKEYPRILGCERVTTRALAGLATAYAAEGDVSRARQLASEVIKMLKKVQQPENSGAGACLPELFYVVAVAHVRTRDISTALYSLEKAVQTGWRDSGWLQRDSELLPLRKEPRFQTLVQQARSFSAVEFQLSSKLSEGAR